MKECREHIVRVGFTRTPKKIFDEIEAVSAEMLRNGWKLHESCFEDGLANIHLLFERDVGNCTTIRETIIGEENI